MSFLSDLFEGHTSNLGNDLNPSNIFSDAGSDYAKQPSWLKDIEIAAPLAIGAGLTLGGDLPAFAGLGGAFGAADTVGGSAAGIGGDLGADLSTTVGGGLSDLGDAALPATATLDAGTGITGGVASGLTTGADTVGGGLSGSAIAAPAGVTAGATSALPGAAGIAGQTVGTDLGTIAAPTSVFDSISDTLAPVGTAIKGAAPYVGALGLGGSLYEGYEQKQAINATNKQEQQNAINAGNIAAQAQSIAAPLLNNGQALTTYLTSGTLPPQFQTQVDQTIASQKAGIIQGYASRGMSTDPQKNSQLQQDLAAVDNSRNELMTSLESTLATAGQNMINTANSLLASGISATNLESQIPIEISKLNQDLNTQMSQAISNFAAAINGGQSGGQKFSLVSTG